jgi:WD40 repeat protein
VAERGEKPTISIYDLTTLKKKNSLRQFTETAAQEYVSLSFSFDGKFLAAILGDPDWTLIYFQWEKGKIDSMTKAKNPTTSGRVTQVQSLNSIVTCSHTSNVAVYAMVCLIRNQLPSCSCI